MIYSVFNHRKGDRFITDYSLLGAKETIQPQLLCIVNAIFPIGVCFYNDSFSVSLRSQWP